MKIILYFQRDADGQPRLLHAYDEVEAQEHAGSAPPSLVAAMDACPGRPGETRALIQIDTDDPIVRDKPDAWDEVLGPMLNPVDFDTLLPTDQSPVRKDER